MNVLNFINGTASSLAEFINYFPPSSTDLAYFQFDGAIIPSCNGCILLLSPSIKGGTGKQMWILEVVGDVLFTVTAFGLN